MYQVRLIQFKFRWLVKTIYFNLFKRNAGFEVEIVCKAKRPCSLKTLSSQASQQHWELRLALLMSRIQSPLSDCRYTTGRREWAFLSLSYKNLHNHFITKALQKQSALTAEISKVCSTKDTLASVAPSCKMPSKQPLKDKKQAEMKNKGKEMALVLT